MFSPASLQVLVRPLRAMCRYQIEHGAVKHHSKDDPEYVSRREFKCVCVCVCDFVVMVAGEVKRHVSEKDSEETVFRGQEGLLYR